MIVLTDKHKIPFQIDDEDWIAVSRYPWAISKKFGYPTTTIGQTGSWRKTILLHAFIMGHAPKPLEWDHIDRDRTNNRRSNLRLVTSSGNKRNRAISKKNKSGVVGVTPGRRSTWVAGITVGGKSHYLGERKTIAEAAELRRLGEVRFGVSI